MARSSIQILKVIVTSLHFIYTYAFYIFYIHSHFYAHSLYRVWIDGVINKELHIILGQFEMNSPR